MPEATAPVDALVYGAGAIGLYLGGRLAAAGWRVHFVGRAALIETLRRDGLRLRDLEDREWHLPPASFSASIDLQDAPPATCVLLTVKGPATGAAARDLGAHCVAGTPVFSFQNGVDNPARIAVAAPALCALPAMVPFNVVQPALGTVKQATSGYPAALDGDAGRRLAQGLTAAGMPLALHADMLPVQWGKLLLNLNNPINALAGVPLREELENRAWRRVLAALQDEALACLKAARIVPLRATPLPTTWMPTLLRLPTPLFRRLARRMLSIDPQARSSMYDDRVRARPTEIDDLCGAVVRLGEQYGVATPCNRSIQHLVESAPQGRFYAADEVLAALR